MQKNTTVTDAVMRRISTRAFLDQPVDPALLRQILTTARYAPSGGNVQPWNLYVLGGAELASFKASMRDKLVAGIDQDGEEYPIYPPNLFEPHRSRRFQCAEDMYGTMGIARADKPARLRFIAGNYQFWNAPVAMFFCVDRRMGAPQWSDLGMLIQTIMLLAQEAGLATCAQEAWTCWHKTVGEFLALPPELMLFCGLALGYADPAHPVNSLRTARAPLEEIASFRGI
ncbi:MAG: nitroreductase [Steroidobacteraceae bacterium]